MIAGTAESIPLPDESADAVFVGEAFHWFDAEREALTAELRPLLSDPYRLPIRVELTWTRLA